MIKRHIATKEDRVKNRYLSADSFVYDDIEQNNENDYDILNNFLLKYNATEKEFNALEKILEKTEVD